MVGQQEYSIIIMVKNINNGDLKFSNNNLGLRLGSVFTLIIKAHLVLRVIIIKIRLFWMEFKIWRFIMEIIRL